jgi:hypothetical protein
VVPVLGTSIDNWAAQIIARLIKKEGIRLYANDQIMALKLQEREPAVLPRWAFQFDKLNGIIRKPGLMIVQLPKTKTPTNIPYAFSIPEWFDHDNALLRFIDAIFVYRRISDAVDPGAFSEVLGGQEHRLYTPLHATLIAALAISCTIGGQDIVHRVVEAALTCGLDYAPHAPTSKTDAWQGRNRIKCPCEKVFTRFTHGPLTPVAAAKAIGINVWQERNSSVLPRVWDLKKDKLVENIDVTDVIFLTHRWEKGGIVYKKVAIPTILEHKHISSYSMKLKRIRDTLSPHTGYVWLDTICVDKSNLSELDETIRSMYRWYSNCQAVVLEEKTTLDVWRGRGWCLQEGAAAGSLYGMSGVKIVSFQSLAKAQNAYLCQLDLSLYYRRGNAVEILARMDMRQTERQENMAYALAGILSVHLTLAYGEQGKARQRLLQELVTQKGDLSFLSFSANEANSGSHFLLLWRQTFRIAHCIVPLILTLVSHLGLTIEAQLIDKEDTEKILDTLNALTQLKTHSEGRYIGLKGLISAVARTNTKKATTVQMAIVHSIRSVMLIEVYGSDLQTGGSAPIKCCTRLQCCQIEDNEFQRLLGSFAAVKPERIWLGDKKSIRI